MLSETELKRRMVQCLKLLNTTPGLIINNSTIHDDVLDAGDGPGLANSAHIYKSLIRRELVLNGHTERAWPANWLQLSVDQLAPKII